MVKSKEEERTDEGRFRHAQETNDVGRWQEENWRGAKAPMGEGQSSQGHLERGPFQIAR